jgi:tetratricopeptide (TPR) repeat protein
MSKGSKVDRDARLVYVLLRYESDLDQAGFAALTRTSESQVSLYLRGERTVPQEILERAAEALDFPVNLLRPARRAVRSFRVAAKGWSRADRALAETVSTELLACTGEALEVILSSRCEPPRRLAAVPGAADREAAAGLWLRLEPRNSRQRLAVAEELPEYQSWALCELVCAKSIETAPSSPARALELAELALRIADLCYGEEWLRQRARGYAWFHVANARRATNDLSASVAALDTAAKLWEAGAPGDPGLFHEAIVLALEANIQKSQRRFPEALQKITEALTADRGELRGKLLLTKSQILRAQGDVEGSTRVLREAIPHVQEEREPRTALGVRSQFLLNLCLQDRAVEAAPHLPEVQSLAQQLGNEVDLVRVNYLGALITSGLGKAEEAEEAFNEARRRFADFEPPLVFDYSLVSLDLGLLLLGQGRTVEVRALADEMAWIFTSQGVQREALAAIKLFCDAAQRETATVEMARSVIRFLHQSQHDPELKFGETEEAGMNP